MRPRIKSYQQFVLESTKAINVNVINSFINDFGFFITLNLSQVTKMGIDSDSTNELINMMKNIRKPIINGMSYVDLVQDLQKLYKSPKLLSAFFSKIREFILYIEPRIQRFVKDGEYKNNWLSRISKLKNSYKTIITSLT